MDKLTEKAVQEFVREVLAEQRSAEQPTEKEDTCANCGRTYYEHERDTHCFKDQEGKWFPRKIADAIIKMRTKWSLSSVAAPEKEKQVESETNVRVVRPVDRSVLGQEAENLIPLSIADDRDTSWVKIVQDAQPEGSAPDVVVRMLDEW